MSQGDPAAHIVDTVVALYFLVVGQFALLEQLLGSPVCVPDIVFDPQDADASTEDVSELRKAMRWAEARPEEPSGELVRIDDLAKDRRLVSITMTFEERLLFAELSERKGSESLGLGEAACIAIALSRELVLVTDDNAAIREFQKRTKSPQIERIRSLLLRAVDEELLSMTEARKIHEGMKSAGFWDTQDLTD